MRKEKLQRGKITHITKYPHCEVVDVLTERGYSIAMHNSNELKLSVGSIVEYKVGRSEIEACISNVVET